MTRLAQVVFGVLVVAAFAAFFVAQELKSTPSVIGRFQLLSPVVSPNGDGRRDQQRVTFRLKKSDDVDVAVVDADGDEVRELGSGVHLRAYRSPAPGTFAWDGKDADGNPVPDGLYRIRITLRGQGRSVIVRDAFRVDRTPPQPLITSIGPERGVGPELLPTATGEPARITINAPTRHGRLLVFATTPGHVRQVYVAPIPDGTRKVDWSGRVVDGAEAGPGTYLAVIETRDVAGNIGTSAPLGKDGLPVVGYGQTLPGRGGITVRKLAVQPPLLATPTGDRIELGTDARGKPYRWTLRRVGHDVLRRGRATQPRVRPRAPGSVSGTYQYEVRRSGLVASTPLGVEDEMHHKVLAVLPLMNWQADNPGDDDGDGWPNLLATGHAVKLRRVLATRAPAGFAQREAPTLRWLDSEHHRYDIATDLALALEDGAKLIQSHTGVLLLGDETWLPPLVQKRLRRFVQRGGTVVSMGIASLRRQATLTPGLRLIDPTPPATADLFGSRIAAPRRGTYDLTNATDDIGLFEGTEGVWSGFGVAEVTTSPGSAKLVASAVDGDGRTVIVGLRVGKGLVIRFGLPELPRRLATDADVQALMGRAWELLSR